MESMLTMSISLWGVIAAVIVANIAGMLWYSPLLFGRQWMTLSGVKPPESAEDRKKGAKALAKGIVPSIITAYVLGVVLSSIGIFDAWSALKVGLLVWIGFVGAIGLYPYIYKTSSRSGKLFFIEMGYHFVALLLMALVMSFFI